MVGNLSFFLSFFKKFFYQIYLFTYISNVIPLLGFVSISTNSLPSPIPIRVFPLYIHLIAHPCIFLCTGGPILAGPRASFSRGATKRLFSTTYRVGVLCKSMYSLLVVVKSLEALVCCHSCSYGVASSFNYFNSSYNSPQGGPVLSSVVCC